MSEGGSKRPRRSQQQRRSGAGQSQRASKSTKGKSSASKSSAKSKASRPRAKKGQPGGISDELQPYVDAADAEAINRVGDRLNQERPLPTAALRTELRAHLSEARIARPAWQPKRLRPLVAAYLGSGVALLAIAAIGLSGAGPLGY